jgi:hypothetical protein
VTTVREPLRQFVLPNDLVRMLDQRPLVFRGIKAQRVQDLLVVA